MNILSRVKSIFNAKANAVLDEMENPEEVLEFSLVEMKEQVEKIKKTLVEVTAVKKRLESDLYDIRGKMKISEEQAELSMASDREDLALAALEKKQELIDQDKRISAQIEDMKNKISTIIRSKEQLEERVEELKNKKEELIAMNKAAEAQIVVKETITGMSEDISDINQRISRAEHKIKEKNAKVSAIDELIDMGTLGEFKKKYSIEAELSKIQKEHVVKQELLRLKQKHAGGAE